MIASLLLCLSRRRLFLSTPGSDFPALVPGVFHLQLIRFRRKQGDLEAV
jgi:hypothetical protein